MAWLSLIPVLWVRFQPPAKGETVKASFYSRSSLSLCFAPKDLARKLSGYIFSKPLQASGQENIQKELESNLGLLLRLRSHQPKDEYGSSCHEHVSQCEANSEKIQRRTKLFALLNVCCYKAVSLRPSFFLKTNYQCFFVVLRTGLCCTAFA